MDKLRDTHFLSGLLLAACMAALSGSPLLANAGEDERQMTADARQLSGQLLEQLRSEVARELETSGPLRAVSVCKFSAPEIVANISRLHGMRVTRVSLKPRNRATGEADAWEQKILLDFERRIAKGEKVESLEVAGIVQEPAGRYFRYMKAIPTRKACTTCHGTDISDAIKTLLASEYPYDKATGYSVGQVRGALSIKKPL